MFISIVPSDVVHDIGNNDLLTRFIVEPFMVDGSDYTVRSLVTVGEFLKLELSLRVLVVERNSETDTFVERLEGKIVSQLFPVAVFEELHWIVFRETCNRSVSLLVEGHSTRVSDGHDAVFAWRTSDLDWVDGGSWGLTGGDDGVGSDGHVPFEPSGEGVGLSQPDGVHEESSELFIRKTRSGDFTLERKLSKLKHLHIV